MTDTVPIYQSSAVVLPPPERLYTVVDGSLSCGRKAAQAIHAVAEFALVHGDSFRKWHDNGNYVIVVEAPNANALYRLHHDAERAGHTVMPFYEPDFGDRMTAITFRPSPEVADFLAHLPSASKHKRRRFRFKNPFKR